MGAKFSKGGKVKQNGTDATLDESLDTFNKTSTLPASFRKKDDEVTKAGTLPRGGVDLARNTSFSKRFRKSITKLVGQNEVSENASESQVPTEPSSVVLGQEECKDKLKDVIEEEVDCKVETPRREVDLKSAQKRARAQFFQDLYTSKEQAHIPKPPRSRNIPSPLEKVEPDADITVPATLGTPVVKLIKKHEGEIEKQQEHIGTNNSINSPEYENKDDETPGKVSDVYSEPMIKDDVVCASEKQVGEIKQLAVVKEETTLKKEEIAITQSMSSAASSYEKESIAITSEKQVKEIKKEEVSVVKDETYLREETSLKEEVSMTQTNDMNIEQEKSFVKFEENISSYETETLVMANAMQVEEIKQDEVSVVKEETTLTEETILKEEISMTQSLTSAASNDIQIEKENSSVRIEDNISSYETESIVVTSLSSENVENFSEVEITKELLYDATDVNNGEILENEAVIENNVSNDNEVKESHAIGDEEIEHKKELTEEETIVEKSKEIEIESEPEQKDNEEPVMTKDNGVHAVHESENKDISSQEEEENMIDQNISCNTQQDIRDDNFTEPNSLESINQNDEINQTVTENKNIIECTVTGKNDLVKEPVILDNDAKGPYDLRSEGGSEGGISTDEGIVASDDEENKSDLHKVDNLEATENKSTEKLSEGMEAEKML